MKTHAPLWRWMGVASTLAALTGCASMPNPQSGARSAGPVSAAQGAFSNGSVCYAPPPNLRAAYNQPYEINGQWYHPLRSDAGYDQRGIASWYNVASSSRVTAMGTAFHDQAYTAASRTLPLPSCVRVTNLDNGRSLMILVNDRGPFVSGRIMDLSMGSAHALGMVQQGTTRVQVQAVHAVSLPSPSIAPSPAPRPLEISPPTLISATATPGIPALPQQPDQAAQARLRAVVANAFGSAPPIPPKRSPTVLAPRAPIVAAPKSQPRAIYLVSQQSMDLPRAVAEQRKLHAFGITTAKLVNTGSSAYAVKIGPLANTDSTQGYVDSLARLQLGTFTVSGPN